MNGHGQDSRGKGKMGSDTIIGGAGVLGVAGAVAELMALVLGH